jgi:sugar/nucleoside kinase (ribokinase family)
MPRPPNQPHPPHLPHPAQYDVVGVGGNAVDYVYTLPAYPEPQGPNAKIRISRQSILCGGQMATALCTCASLGLRAKYIGATGTDDNGRRIREELARRGLDLSDVIVREGTNQFAVIMLSEQAGERIVLWDRDDRLALHDDELRADRIQSARLVHVDDVDPRAAIRAATLARDASVPVTSDIDRLTDLTQALVDVVSVPIFAEHVPPALTGELDLERALRKLQRPHHRQLCVTLGPHGSMMLDGDRLHESPAFHVTTVDTTGAGDVFRGAFIYAYLRGDAPAEVLRFANAAAAISCTRLGAINGVPTLAETEGLIQESSKLKS